VTLQAPGGTPGWTGYFDLSAFAVARSDHSVQVTDVTSGFLDAVQRTIGIRMAVRTR
jgi:hypothetical protein